jgi:hypothetical protein
MWCCGVSLLGVGVGARFEAVLPDGSRVSAKGSPTNTLKQHVANELFASTPTAVVQAIDRLCVFNYDGGVEYCTTSLSWAVVSSEPTMFQAQVSGSVTVPASITVTHFRAKAGATLYFESAVSPNFDVLAGQTVSLTMTLTLSASHSPSVSGGLPSVSATNSSNLLGLLYLILRGARPSGTYLTLEGVRWVDGVGTVLLARELVRSYSSGATSGGASHDFANFTAGGSLARVHVDCENQADCIVYTLSSTLSVTTSDRARYIINVSVS